MRILVNASTLVSGGGVQVGVGYIKSTFRLSNNEYFYLVSRAIYNELLPLMQDAQREKMYLIERSPGTVLGWIYFYLVVRGVEKRFKPDIVYSIGFPSYYSFDAAEIGRYTNPWDIFPEPLPWHVFSSPLGRLRLRLATNIRRIFARRAFYFETQTPYARDCISEALRIPVERVSVIPNSINPEYKKYADREYAVESQGLLPALPHRAFCIAADHLHKNLKIIPDIALTLLECHNLRVTFVFTLPRDSATWRIISRSAASLGVEDLVINEGILSISECIAQYNKSSFVLLPTLLEVFSASYLEAMIMNRPIVTSDLGFARDICGSVAIYAKSNDVNDFARKIHLLLESPRVYQDCVHYGRRRFLDFPSTEVRLNSVDNMFKYVSSLTGFEDRCENTKEQERGNKGNSSEMNVSTQGRTGQRPYQICTKTVMDTSDPNITFDQDGISNHYWNYCHNDAPLLENLDLRREELAQIVANLKEAGKGKEFDCIMGLSGGADSSYMLHIMVTKYGVRPLVFHVDGGWNSDIAVSNINCLVDRLGLDLYTEVINWEEMRDFQLAMFKSGVPHIDIPQDMAFGGVLYRFAEKHGIKYILNGGNISTECLAAPLQFLYWGTDMVHVRDILSKYGTMPMPTYPFLNILYHKVYLRYFRGVQTIKPLNYFSYIKRDAMIEMERVYGWKTYPQKHFESRFTRFFEGYWLPTRFGWDMRRIQFSSLILTGQVSRDEALRELELPSYDPETIDHDFSYVAAKLGIDVDELRRYHELPLKFYWDYRNQSQLFSVGERALNWLTGTRRGGAS
jgi:N-acetyl sugar amidotransferase